MSVDVAFTSEMTVQLVDHMGDDERVCQAARVSTLGAASVETHEAAGLIRYLAKNRHGSPFEHGAFTWLLQVPTVVVWQLVRHRIASYNIESGRYRQLEPLFYIPPRERPLVQVGKPGAYEFIDGTDGQYQELYRHLQHMAYAWWMGYKTLLDIGIANEVARLGLPFHLYWSVYVTMNPRALMNFLSLRTEQQENSRVPSFPQAEIASVATLMEADFARIMPLTHQAWNDAGRLAP